ncbi:MAG: ADP-ribosylglycohydrolase family protein, partial [Acidobacteria bacterium]|nr:ADP-ribosylglycohydrolase family protein [Acidobacteriota bacterium]
FLARTTRDKEQIREEVTERFGYDLSRTLAEIRPGYAFDVSCQGTVPEAIIAFLEADSYEDAVRNAVSLGGDSDTLAAISGAIAEAHYGGIGPELLERVRRYLPAVLWSITERFRRRYVSGAGGPS